MTTDNRPPSGPAGRRDRRPPIIDLGASEFARRRRAALDWLRLRFRSTLAISAVVLALAVAIALLWPRGDGGVSALEARLARMEQQVRDLAGRSPPPSVDPATVDGLAGRLAKLEAGAAAPRVPATDPALASGIAALDGELKSLVSRNAALDGELTALAERIGALARRSDEIAADARGRGDANANALADLTQKLAQFSQPVTQNETGERSVRLAVAAAMLRAAVERGEPFTAELAAAKALTADPAALAPLEPFAASGLPAAAPLARELLALTPTLAHASATPARDGGILGRLQANAEKLIRVRPIEEIAGDDPAAVIARIEARAAQSDLAGALAELAKLPEGLRAPARGFIAKAEARNAAADLSRRFAAGAVAALAKPSP
jgi:hypothetical protein